jgi:phosphomannomutase
VRAAYGSGAEVEELDGLSITHPTWRLNMRQSNTEPLVRLNLEAKGSAVDVAAKAAEVAAVIKGATA